MVTSHGEANHQAIQLPVHKKRITRFVNKDLEDWPTAVHDDKKKKGGGGKSPSVPLRSVSAGTDTTEYESLFVGHSHTKTKSKIGWRTYLSLATRAGG